MAITHVNTQSANSATQSLTITKPTSIADDDILFGFIGHSDDNPVVTLGTLPTGWVLEGGKRGANTATSNPRFWLVYKIITNAAGEPANYTFTWDLTGGTFGGIVALRGVNSTGIFDQIGTSSGGAGLATSITAPAVTTVNDEEWIFRVAIKDAGAVFTGTPATNRINQGNTAGGNGGAIAVSDTIQTTAGDTGVSGAFTLASDEWDTWTITVNPAPVGGNFNQASFRGRNDDGSETAATWKAAVNTNWNQRQDQNFRVRFLVQEDDDVEDLDVQFQLQYNLNSGGWNDVNGSSNVVRSFASANFADGDTTTQLLGVGTFIGTNGGMDEVNGLAGGATMDFTTTINQETEVEYCCQIRSADTVRGDTIQLRLVKEADVLFGTYTSTPTLTVPEGAGMMMASAYKKITTAGAENPATFNFSKSLPWAAVTIAVRPDTSSVVGVFAAGTKFNEVQHTTGFVRNTDTTTIDNMTFTNLELQAVKNLTGVTVKTEVEFKAAGTYTFTGCTINQVTNTSVGNVILNLLNSTVTTNNSPSTLTINNTKAVSITVKDISDNSNIENARVLLETDTGGNLPYQESVSITRVTTTATVTHTAHGLANGDKVVIRGANELEYNGVKTITYIDANSYSYTVSGSPASPATGTIICSAVILEGLTNASGVISISTFNYSADQPIKGVARKSSSSPYFIQGAINGTITTAGFSTIISLVRDE